MWVGGLYQGYYHTEGVWPRLQSSLEKPHWISLDFDQWEYQQEEGEESDGETPKIEFNPEMMKKIVRGGGRGGDE